MKKALSVLLSVLVIFSMVGVMAFAEGEATEGNLVTVVFKDGDNVLASIQVVPGTNLTQYAPEEPTKPATEETEYIFKGWDYVECETDGDRVYYSAGLPTVGEEDMTFVAVYSENDISGYQSFWNFVESLFERINRLFEYFAEIFQW